MKNFLKNQKNIIFNYLKIKRTPKEKKSTKILRFLLKVSFFIIPCNILIKRYNYYLENDPLYLREYLFFKSELHLIFCFICFKI